MHQFLTLFERAKLCLIKMSGIVACEQRTRRGRRRAIRCVCCCYVRQKVRRLCRQNASRHVAYAICLIGSSDFSRHIDIIIITVTIPPPTHALLNQVILSIGHH